MAVSTFSTACRLAVLAIVVANLATSEACQPRVQPRVQKERREPRVQANIVRVIPIRRPGRPSVGTFLMPGRTQLLTARRNQFIGVSLPPSRLLRAISGVSSVNNVMSTSESMGMDESFDENEETTCVKGVCTTKKVKTVCKNGICTNTPAGRALMRMLSGRAVEVAAAATNEANNQDMAALMQELAAVLNKIPENQQEAFAKEWQAITGGNVPEEQPVPAKTGRNLSLIRMLSGRADEPPKVDLDALVKEMAAVLGKVPEGQQEAFEKTWDAFLMASNPEEQAPVPAKTARSFNGIVPVGRNMLLLV